jgi:CRP-like cAMP-binding protein
LRTLRLASIGDICHGLPVAAFAPGEDLLVEGESSGRLYVMVEGVVEVVKGGFQVNLVSDADAIFGDMSALLGLPHTATVRAVAPSRLYVIDGAEDFLRANQDIAFELAKLLAHRLHGVTSYLVDIKRQFEHHQDHLGMVDDILESLVHEQRAPFTPGSDREPDY